MRERPSDPVECGRLLAGSKCFAFTDADPTYYWIIDDDLNDLGPDGFLGPCDGHYVTTVVGVHHWYLHLGGTNLVRVD